MHSPTDTVSEEGIKAMQREVMRMIRFSIRNHPGALTAMISDLRVFRHMTLHIGCGCWDTIMYEYGIDFLLAILHYYEGTQEFERCHAILDHILWYNKEFNQHLPTHARFNT